MLAHTAAAVPFTTAWEGAQSLWAAPAADALMRTVCGVVLGVTPSNGVRLDVLADPRGDCSEGVLALGVEARILLSFVLQAVATHTHAARARSGR
jgi:hypothetical protein